MFCSIRFRVLYIILVLFMLSGCSATKQKTENEVTITNDVAEQCSNNDDSVEETLSNKELWEEAISLIEKKKYPQAIFTLSKIDEDDRAFDLQRQLRYLISGDYIENLTVGVAAINKEGKVIICMNDEVYEADGYTRVEEWTDVEKLSFVQCGLDAVSSEGTFLTTFEEEESKQRNEELRMISNISIFETSRSTYAVMDQSGRLYFYNKYNDYLGNEAVKKEMEGWSDIVDIVTGENRLAVLHIDGSVSFVYSNKLPDQTSVTNKYSNIYDDMYEWTDIVDISGDDVGNIAALRADGTVLISNHMLGQRIGENYLEVSEWTDIIAISMSAQNILALKRDGSVLTAGIVNEGQKRVAEWTDIVAISAGQNFHIGLKSNGTLVVAGENEGDWSLPDVSEIRDLYVPMISLKEER